MTDFILLLIVGSCWTWGVHCLFTENYILGKPGKYLWDSWPHWLCKPLFACPPCMSSVHGILVSAIYFDWHIFPMMAYIACLCGLNFILKQIIYPEYE